MIIRLGAGMLLALAASACLAQQEQPAAERVKLATGLIAKRDYPSAIRELRRALELQPDLAEAHGLLGQALLAQGYSAEAIAHLESARKLDLLGGQARNVWLYPCDIAGRARFVGNQAKMNCIGKCRRDNGYCLRHVPDSNDGVQAGCNDHVGVQPNQLLRKRR